MSNQKVKQPVTAEIIERLDSVLNEMNALYASEKDWERMSDLSEELSQIEEQYDMMDTVYEVHGKKGVKDIKGNVRVPALYSDIAALYAYTSFRHTPVIVLNDEDGKAALMNHLGQLLTPLELDKVYKYMPVNGLIEIQMGDKSGLYDYCNHLYVRPIYDEIDEENGKVYVKLGERWGFVNGEDGTFIDEDDEDTLGEVSVLSWMD